KVKDQPKYAPLIERIERDLTEMLIARERWADLGRMVADPVATLERELQLLEMIKGMPERQGQTPEMKEAQAQYEKFRQEKFRKDIGNMYAGLLAADRDEVALKYALRARQADKSPELVRSLAQSALDAKEPREQQADWLAEASQDALSKELAEKIRAALKATKP
ncbi:MAG: hypothetical protein K2X32_15350, partial [Phycisphaerales bacterium]|nr:hypothetical protein [Phycisphaerales bacterium]